MAMPMPCRLLSLSLVLLFLVPVSAAKLFAGVTGKIAGRVLDARTREPLVGAHVAVTGTRMGGTTDASGDYYIINVAPGTYSLMMSYVGYETLNKISVLVSADRTTRVDASLAPAVIEGNAITVTAERPVVDKDVTSSEQIVSGETMSHAGSNTVIEAISTQTGVFVSPTSLAWTRGERTSYFRGSNSSETVYMLDNLSMNSGLLSDNYSGYNTSAIQEISLLTGGYNAEYGDARSAIVNIVSKEAATGLKGTFRVRMRPAGIYHFGKYFYDKSNYDYAHFDLAYWTEQSKTSTSAYYGKNPDSLLAAWRKQITPNDTLAKYNQRPEFEYEGTLYGGISEDLNFLVSGRYKRGVGIFPQAIPYNPEMNVQGYVNYKISPDLKLKIGGLYGQYESADYLSVNQNTDEASQEATWLAPMRVDEQYARAKYNPMGAIYRQWPEYRIWNQLYARLTQMLNSDSYYEINLSYLRDHSDRSDRYNRIPDSLWSTRDDVTMMVDRFLLQGYYHTWEKSDTKIYQLKADYVNQITKNHQLKTGGTLKLYDFWYNSFTGTIEGGTRTNYLNIYSGKPYEGNVYAQDKMEFVGLVINLGFRFDFFNQNRMAAANMFDPLAFETTTAGHVAGETSGIPGSPEMIRTTLKKAFAPRFGVSHPISDNSVLHFQYGHFYQRPSWNKMFGMPFMNHSEDASTMENPYAKQETYMQEWSGYYGNPDLGYERTIQYELGFDNNIANLLRLDITGYYKDASRIADVVTGLYSVQHTADKALMVTNSGYADVRGIETKVESRMEGPANAGLSHEIYWSFSGAVGYNQLNEAGSIRSDVPKGLDEDTGPWSAYHRIKAWASYVTKPDEGPEFFGCKPLSDLNVYVSFWWRSGDRYTYHASGDASTEPNNMRWFNYYQMNLKVAKGFTVSGVRTELSIDVRNLFNWKFLTLLTGDDMTYYQEHPNLPLNDRLPKNWYSGEYNEWEWYTYEVPPRQVYLELKVDF